MMGSANREKEGSPLACILGSLGWVYALLGRHPSWLFNVVGLRETRHVGLRI